MLKKIIIFLLITLISGQVFAEIENPCFNAIQKHISEAIKHNENVSALYSQLSNGESNRLSFNLISMEKASSFLIKSIELKSRFYQIKGVNLLCDELASMNNLPVFQNYLTNEKRPNQFYKYDFKNYNKNLKLFIQNDQMDEAYQFTADELQKLDEAPNQLCLTRHFLESIARTIKLSQGHRNEALKLGLPDPLKLIQKFIKFQSNGLIVTHLLDLQAFPLQKKGLMIYCQDVPVIDWK